MDCLKSKETFSHRWNSLEVLRFFAAILVFLSHLNPKFNVPTLKNFFGANLFLGSIGLDLFFVISGFVVAASVERASKDARSALRFFLRRLVRIFPLYIVATLAWVALTGAEDLDFISVFKSLILFPEWNDPLLYVGWSLRFEILFYAFAAISILFKFSNFVLMLFVLLGVLLGTLLNSVVGGSIVIEFCFGVLLFLFREIWLSLRSRTSRTFRVCLLLTAIAVFMLASLGRDFGETNHFRQMIFYSSGLIDLQIQCLRFLAWGIPAAFVVFACLLNEELFSRSLARIGDFTYSIYLSQLLALTLVKPLRPYSFGSDSLFLLMILVSLAGLTSLFYFLIDRPVLRYLRRNLI